MASGVEQSKHVLVVSGRVGEGMIMYDNVRQVGENLNLLQALCTVNIWLLFLKFACGMGSGLATVNNISQIGESLGYSSLEATTLISLWSIWNFLDWI